MRSRSGDARVDRHCRGGRRPKPNAGAAEATGRPRTVRRGEQLDVRGRTGGALTEGQIVFGLRGPPRGSARPRATVGDLVWR